MMRKYLLLMSAVLAVSIPPVTVAQDKPAVVGGGSATQVTDPEIQRHLDTNLPKLRNPRREDREAAIHELHQGLMTISNSQQKFPQGAAC